MGDKFLNFYEDMVIFDANELILHNIKAISCENVVLSQFN